jgi:uncharacterized protein (TIGR03086 family)
VDAAVGAPHSLTAPAQAVPLPAVRYVAGAERLEEPGDCEVGTDMDQMATLEYAVHTLQRQAVALTDDDMDVVSNCEPWTVRRVASHALNNQLLWAGLVTGEHIVSPDDTMGAVPYDGDLATYADEVTDRSLAMWRTPGVLEAVHATPFGELPGSVVINFSTIDALCHAWDLALSCGAPIEFAPDMIPAVSEVVAATCTDAVRDLGLIKPVPPTPTDATDTERLMAQAGRAARV